MADFFYKHKGKYPALDKVKLKKLNYAGLGAYVIASVVAYVSPGVAPVNGIIAAIIAYIILDVILKAVGMSQDHM